ncbi:MAG: hypothetical protein LBV26_00135 [Bacteroidales bacterium]|jgi:hypothetical protein|nr:hypothetical protein [Bacteroidales bacterium]
MKRLFLPLFNLAVMLVMSCEDTGLSTDCSECMSYEPVTARIEVQIDAGNEHGTLVQFWEGKLEDGIMIDSVRYFSTAVFEKELPLNRLYTITATYVIDGKTYTAVDSATPKTKYDKNSCDEPCYNIYGNTVNLKLKYTN